jgi:chorismate mutase
LDRRDRDLELRNLRCRIDLHDRQILRAVNERAKLVAEVRELKGEMGLPARDEAREAEIRARMNEWNDGPLTELGVGFLTRTLLRSTGFAPYVRLERASAADTEGSRP